jgi:hypothetical protein
MELTNTPTETAPEASGVPAEYETCDQCGAPVERSQRYCVACGSRRKHVSDPATRFLSGAASRSRAALVAPATLSASAGVRGRRRAGLGTALAIAAIPIAVALGVLVGRAGNGTDAKLLAALRAQKAEVVNIGGGSVGTSAAASSKRVARKRTSKNSNATGKVLSTTSYGSFHSVAALTTPSASQLNQNAQIVKRVQGQINSSYVNSQKNLPNQISVP